MMRLFRAAAAVVAMAIWLAGCATPGIPFDRASAGGIKTVGIVTPSFPDDAEVVLASTVGQSFGLIGGLIDAGMQANRDSKFNAALRVRNFAARDAFVAALTEKLRAEGYEVVAVPASRDKKDFLANYPTGAEPRVDAYLDAVASGYGYVAAGIRSSTPYRPTLVVRARLVSAKNAAVLMQDVVAYNPVAPTGPSKAVTIAPDPAYQFVDFDALMSDADRAALGLKSAVEQSAQSVGALLN
jgi:hypothetical protein